MKKLKLDSTNFVSSEVLTRAQLKSIHGGAGSNFKGIMHCNNQYGMIIWEYPDVNCNEDQWDFHCREHWGYRHITSYCDVTGF